MYKKTLGYIIAIAYVSLLIVFSNPTALADGSKNIPNEKISYVAMQPLAKLDVFDKAVEAAEEIVIPKTI